MDNNVAIEAIALLDERRAWTPKLIETTSLEAVHSLELNVKGWTERGTLCIAKLKSTTDGLKIKAEETDRVSEKNQIVASVERLQGVHKQLQSALRDARVQAKAIAERRSMLELAALTTQEVGGKTNSRPKKAEDSSAELTQSLAAAVHMISEEVERSAQAAQALEQQTDTLQRTREQYGVYSGVLTQSAAIVSELATRDRMDRLMLLVGLLIFLASAVYVVRRRVGWIFAFPFGATSATTTTTSKLISASTSSTIVESTTVTDVVEHWIASAVEDVLETVVYQRDGEEL